LVYILTEMLREFIGSASVNTAITQQEKKAVFCVSRAATAAAQL
jgi:hypothetical protein